MRYGRLEKKKSIRYGPITNSHVKVEDFQSLPETPSNPPPQHLPSSFLSLNFILLIFRGRERFWKTMKNCPPHLQMLRCIRLVFQKLSYSKENTIRCFFNFFRQVWVGPNDLSLFSNWPYIYIYLLAIYVSIVAWTRECQDRKMPFTFKMICILNSE